MPQVFISYSRHDTVYAHTLARYIKRAWGLDVWIDDRIEPSEIWSEAIEKALDRSTAIIVIMTPESHQSEWVNKEIARVLNRKPIFPLLLSGQNWPMFDRIQYVDVRTGDLPSEDFFETLAKAVSDPPPAGYITPQPSSIPPQKTGTVVPPPPSPQIEWCPVEHGWITLQSAAHITAGVQLNKKYSNIPGTGEQQVFVESFEISKFPITNADFNLFLSAEDGYNDERWWVFSPQAQQWHRDFPLEAGFARPIRGMSDRMPRPYISWYAAVAFCRWLSHRTGQKITLPTESQWQRAAQGDDNRPFPWGRKFKQNVCNYGQAQRILTPVDAFSNGESPYGVADLCGNVWEWCLNEWGADPSLPIRLLGNMPRVIRGGSYASLEDELNVTYRFWCYTDAENDQVGFRIVKTD